MVKGCKKSIVYLKNTGSEIFKEAYFILNEGKGLSILCERDLVSEAARIIEENSAHTGGKKKGFKRVIKRNALPFFLGLSVGIVGIVILLVV